ncbi:lipocalin family protein [Pontibacter anaerobius]|uniref:Lipocalin family protein n=1 Tax=Pontibacter anaerobius TaxID=2993940 RepID=A0ABT3RIG3_9BACT|nr:lipocalin family protein [Pontibacter anaerobius]MCX2741286.1 lipocalin family protein [Pontibacter anaerobius]
MKQQTKLILTAGAVLAGVALVSSYSRSHAPLKTVPHVDLHRYMGRWYEIARLPQRYEKGCHCVYAEYSLNPEGYVEVKNTCHKGGPNGKTSTAEGKGFPVGGSNNSKLRVQFFWPFRGDYWILELDPDYHYVLVGSPDRESLWVLSRTPTLDQDVLEHLVQLADQKGFPVEKLQLTDQSCFTQE